MRFLIDEMFAADVADQLRDVGHDAVHVPEVGLGAGADGDVLAFAVNEGRVVVTENAADFLPLLDAQIAAGIAVAPVVIVLKGKLPRGSGAMSHALVVKLGAWAERWTDPDRYVHWLT